MLWRPEPRGEDKPDKVPYQIAYPSARGASTNPATWGLFEDAVEAYQSLVDLPAIPDRGPIAGIGVVLTEDSDIVCIDLDRVIDAGGHLNTRAETIVDRVDSWTEVSPSGTGLHVFPRGRIPRAIKGDQIEVYARDRYICITGHQWPGTPNRLRPQQPYLDHVVQLNQASEPVRRPWTGAVVLPPDDLAGALLAKLERWGIRAPHVKRWQDGYLVELEACPWAAAHSTGAGGAAVIIRQSGAFDFVCLHAHCGRRDWRDFRALMEGRAA